MNGYVPYFKQKKPPFWGGFFMQNAIQSILMYI